MKPVAVIKRDGRTVPFAQAPIAAAIARALQAVGERDDGLAAELARVVEEHLARVGDRDQVPLEEIQDAVVHVLQESGHYEVAIAYARYRDARERARRERRARGEREEPVNLAVIDDAGRRHAWAADWVLDLLARQHGVAGAHALDALAWIEDQLAATTAIEIGMGAIHCLAEAACVRLGLSASNGVRPPLRLPRDELEVAIACGSDGRESLLAAGRVACRQDGVLDLAPGIRRLWAKGRLWVGGLDDPCRGGQFTAVVEAAPNPYQVLANALLIATDAQRHWRRVRIVLPPAILGHLERGPARQLTELVAGLARIAQVHLYCDGRTPLLDRWPFPGGHVGLAVYNEDFLLARHLAERGLPLLHGAHLARGGWTGRVAVQVAINAQGLEGEWSQLDQLAMAAAGVARARMQRLGTPEFAGAELRFAVFGLANASPSSDYIERQVAQEGQRQGITLVRASNLPEEACVHLGRLLAG